MTETVREFCDCRGQPLRIDRRAGAIQGVKILGLTSRNGRVYPPETLQQAAHLYEDAKVNVNHPKGQPGGPRDYQDRIGAIRGVTLRAGEGLFADFYFNPKHALAEQLLWDAEHAPQNVGFSHNVEARLARRDEQVVVEAITRVHSVDLVADPATTRGLFEAEARGAGPAAADARPDLSGVALEDLRAQRPESIETVLGEQRAEAQRLRTELAELQAREALQHKEQLVRRLLREYHLPEPDASDGRARAVTSEQFLSALLAAEGEPAMRGLIEERAQLVRALGGLERQHADSESRPIARDQCLVDGPRSLDAQAFVKAIT